jgi:hypothetical protein
VNGAPVNGAPVNGMLPGGTVNRITWLPGTDLLVGTCHCGAVAEADGPAAMWDWLLAHPEHPEHPERLGRPGRPAHPRSQERAEQT